MISARAEIAGDLPRSPGNHVSRLCRCDGEASARQSSQGKRFDCLVSLSALKRSDSTSSRDCVADPQTIIRLSFCFCSSIRCWSLRTVSSTHGSIDGCGNTSSFSSIFCAYGGGGPRHPRQPFAIATASKPGKQDGKSKRHWRPRCRTPAAEVVPEEAFSALMTSAGRRAGGVITPRQWLSGWRTISRSGSATCRHSVPRRGSAAAEQSRHYGRDLWPIRSACHSGKSRSARRPERS